MGLANRPAPLDAESALRQAAVRYDDAAVARIGHKASEIRRELEQMQDKDRARVARSYAVAMLCGILNTPEFRAQFKSILPEGLQ